MNISLTGDYALDPPGRASLREFAQKVLHLNLARWETAGLWDSNYRPYSWVVDNQIVSNLCIYSLDLLVEGKKRKAGQLCTVGTHPDFRNQGLINKLYQEIREEVESTHDFLFLFAHPEVAGFYEEWGFHRVMERRPEIEVHALPRRRGLRKLNLVQPEEFRWFSQLAEHRVHSNEHLACNNASLLQFNLIYGLEPYAYKIPELNVAIFYKVWKNYMAIYDIVSAEPLDWNELFPYISHRSIRTIVFYFDPSGVGIREAEWVPYDKSHLYIKGPFGLSTKPFIYPVTAIA